ncbi:MAG TPA: TolC family protein, partial [Vicinamibacterales bacterium]|nr:TolC family protein [Vicinamibacterales bacterium]
WCVPARAQTSAPMAAPAVQLPAIQAGTGSNPFLGSVPPGPPTETPLPLSLADAVARALKYNLGAVQGQQDVEQARGARRQALAALLPSISTSVSDVGQQINLEAFGFPSFPGVPAIIGPFRVFDARVYLSQQVLNFPALHHAREEAQKLSAARDDYRNARDLVVLVSANLYLQTVAAQSRIDAATAQRDTAKALDTLAQDLKTAGLTAGIDVLRARLQLQVAQQRLIVAQNGFDKLKLQLARAIGLPVSQPFTLTDKIPYAPLQPMSLDAALQMAYTSRGDYLAAEKRVQAASDARLAARGERLPSVAFTANYGDIGLTVAGARETFAVAGVVQVPVFQGGRVGGDVAQADAELARRRAQLGDIKERIQYDVRAAFLDLKAAEDQLKVAQTTVDLANQELAQARDRFSAGVADNVEVVQAQQAVAEASENYISSLYAHNVAKASLARALGIGEEAVKSYLGGSR